MGKVFQGIFGGSSSKQKSQQTSDSSSNSNGASWNQAYPWLQDNYGSMATQGLGANNFMAQLLGLQGDDGANAAFDKYKESTGYQNTIDSGSRAITGNMAAKGMLNSGATLKGLDKFGQDTGTSFFNNYLDKLAGLSGQGLSAGGLISGAGQQSVNQSQSKSTSQGTSSGSSSTKPGMGQFIGSVMSEAAASDPRLKLDITRVGENDGLSVYDFRYVWDTPDTVRRGYMADEVAEKRPDALGPELPGGYKTIYYSMLPEIK